MKKYAIYGLTALLCFGFVSCDNYEEPNPEPQKNAQGTVLKADEVVVADALTAGTTYDLKSLSEAGENIVLATIAAPNLESYSYKAVVEMSKDGFASSGSFEATVEAANDDDTLYNIVASPDALQDVYVKSISKGPKAKDVQLRYKLYTVSGSSAAQQEARIGGPDTYYGPYTMSVLPFPSDLVIEDNYYLVGTICGWEIKEAIKLNHSDLSPYDDPVFTCKFDVTEGWWWKIIPESTYVTGDWGSGANSQFGVEVNGDESLAGLLMAHDGNNEPQAGCLNVTGPYTLTINMEEMTYEFSLAIECLYTPGNSNGWSQTASQLLTTTDYSNYYGFAHLNGEFKFTSAPDWGGINYGMGAADGQLSNDGGAGNLNAGADGLYWAQANIASLTYSLTPITTIGVIGDSTPGGWDASTNLTPSADFLTWTGTVTFGAGEFKLRCNDAWDIDFGGTADNLVYKGANIPAPAAGTHTVTLHLEQLPYYLTIE